jgi:ribosomal protein S18 acetylase RimI-like enzyme
LEEHVQFTNLSPEDYERIVDVWQRSGLPVRLKGRDSNREVERQIADEPDYFFGLEVDRELVAVVVVSDDGRKGWINRLAVVPEYRRRGIARELIAEAERRLAARGIDIVAVLIEDYNASSLELFQREGYVLHKDIYYLSKRKSQET